MKLRTSAQHRNDTEICKRRCANTTEPGLDRRPDASLPANSLGSRRMDDCFLVNSITTSAKVCRSIATRAIEYSRYVSNKNYCVYYSLLSTESLQ